MDTSSLRCFFWSIAFILFLFLKFQEYSDLNLPVPGIIFDTARNVLSLTMLGALAVMALFMIKIHRSKKEEEKFEKEEKDRRMRQEAKDSNDWEGDKTSSQ
ncbi:MAG: hypothetical protein Q7R89_03920 [bacterium]|nr:hypothetical protein [bacterium]